MTAKKTAKTTEVKTEHKDIDSLLEELQGKYGEGDNETGGGYEG